MENIMNLPEDARAKRYLVCLSCGFRLRFVAAYDDYAEAMEKATTTEGGVLVATSLL